MADIPMIRRGRYLEPLPEGDEAFCKIPDGEWVVAKVSIPRDLRRHRKFFALLKIAFDNQDFYVTREQFRHAVLVGLGWCEVFVLKTGEACYHVKSISFASMDEAEFSRVYSDVLDYLIREHVVGADPRELSAAAMRLLDFA